MLVIVTVEGATATDTFLHGGGLASTTLCMAVLRTSMPEGRSTCSTPTYCTRITFLGSSMGVGKDWAEKSSTMTTLQSSNRRHNQLWGHQLSKTS